MTDSTEAQAELPPLEHSVDEPAERVEAEDDRDFDWRDTEAVIIEEQPKTACYWNPMGQVVLRQRGGPCDEDAFLIFNLEHIPALIFALKQMVEK